MNVRNYLECEVCKSVTLVRTQLGWLYQHPIRLHCGECGILISGTCFQDPNEGNYDFDFKNAEVINEITPKFYIEASGELLTEKLQHYKAEGNNFFYIPPLFNTVWAMNDNYEKFRSKTLQFLYLCEQEWPKLRRIMDLWLSKNYKYLGQEINKYLPKKQFPANNELEYLRGVHQLHLIFFKTVIDEDFFKTTTKFIWREVNEISKHNIHEMHNLAIHFEEQGYLHRYEEKIFSILNHFVDKFKFMIPIFGLKHYQNEIEIEETKGFTTATFEDLKQFYFDCYEVVGDIVRLVIAFNNLKFRNNFNTMVSKRRDIQTLDEFDSKPKGARIGFLDGTEDFDSLVFPKLDNKLRNAIGHNSYKYDGVNQLITYYPSGSESPADANKIFLLDFAQKCWDIFETINNLSELIYQTRKIYYLSQGFIPIDPSVFDKRNNRKIGRNDKCDCGSGKKFKKCCGAN